MPVPVFSYVYLVLAIAALLCALLAAYRRDQEKVQVFVTTCPLMLIGFLCYFNSIPKLFSL